MDKFGQVWTILGKLGQFWASLGKLGQGNKLEKWGKRQRESEKGEMGKGNKNLSGDGEEGGGGESRV